MQRPASTISLRTVFADTARFVARERELLMPVALATSGVAVMGNVLTATPQGPGDFFIVALALNLLGQLALNALALGRGRSVAEAMTIGVTRLPRALGALLIIGIVAVMALLPASLLLPMLGADLLARPPVVPPAAMVVLAVMSAAIAWAGARISLFVPLIIGRDARLVEALRTSIRATAPVSAKLFAFTVMAGLGYVLVSNLVTMGGVLLAAPLANALGLPGLANGLLAAALGLWAAIFSAYASVFQAKLYEALAGEPG